MDLNQYFKWFEESFGQECAALYGQNVLDYVSFLKNIKLNNAKTINHKLSSLRSYNDFLISSGNQNDVVIQKTDMIKFQTEYASPTQVTELEVKQFMQKVFERQKQAKLCDCHPLGLYGNANFRSPFYLARRF
nr:site-specific integrase [Paenibacillus terrigena]